MPASTRNSESLVTSRMNVEDTGMNAAVDVCISYSNSDELRVSTQGSGLGSGNTIDNSIRQIRSDELLDAHGDRAVVTVVDTAQCVEEGSGSSARKRRPSKGPKN